ncbi:MAG: hypothetical protein L6266_04595 [Nanoarchaeota archaeon]|nr:hypothetical protein [Nanoarchaeota archaeon]
MDNQDLVNLVRNSIRDARIIVDNYDYFKEQDNTGLWKDYESALIQINLFNSYLENEDSKLVAPILTNLQRYYLPFVEQFSKEEPSISRARGIGKMFGYVTIGGLIISLIIPEFFNCNIIPGIISLSSFGYAKNLKNARKNWLIQMKRLNDEVNRIEISELEFTLENHAEEIKEHLKQNYSYGKD